MGENIQETSPRSCQKDSNRERTLSVSAQIAKKGDFSIMFRIKKKLNGLVLHLPTCLPEKRKGYAVLVLKWCKPQKKKGS